MATIIREIERPQNTSDNGMGFLLGIIVVVIVIFLMFYYGIPILKSTTGTQVNIPKNIDINIHKSTN